MYENIAGHKVFLFPCLRMHKIANKFDPEGKKHAVEKAMPFALKGKKLHES